jgi:hypothetical protein
MNHVKRLLSAALAVAVALLVAHKRAEAQQTGKKPSIVIIWGDDIGKSNISAYSHGVMSYRTPSIDRIARDPQCLMVVPDPTQSCPWHYRRAVGRDTVW